MDRTERAEIESLVWEDLNAAYEAGFIETLEDAQDAFMEWRQQLINRSIGRSGIIGFSSAY